ncbi:protein disulfide-isomerase [Corythoichthys intestinalis]|uniref:protein disulfide-isomerase n=1 Tax=Corythoichthys intestinalis TaxID=161448 RepID=UPI0025A4D172|nr:protein disulfide-isomerase [Corythoichthys intestinalis]XP_061792020.1 protein disulfide-isomerase-like [Nerophis lumbriciformis]
MTRPLLLLAVAAFFLAASGQETKTASGKGGILQLTRANFNRALRTYKQLLVHFYAPLSADGHHISEVFQATAAALQDSDIKLATVDVAKDKELAKELNATTPPSIRLYLFGDKINFVPCPVPESSASIVTWLKRRAGSAADLITDLSQSVSSEEQLRVIGFFKELDSEYVRVFYAAAVSLPDVNFGLTQNDDVIRKYDVTQNVVLLLKQSTLIQVYEMTPETSREDLMTFISVYQMDPVTEYTGKTANQILSSPVLNHALLFVNKSSTDFHELHAAFSVAAEAFRMKILFVLVDVFEPRNGRLMEYFRVRDFEAPLVRLVNLTNHVTYQLPSTVLDVNSIEAFCQDYLEGKAKPKMQSEPIPEGWDQRPVKELVGSTFEAVAFNPNKTVFVLFYVPYNPESRVVFPLWEELAEAFKAHDDIVVARIDASANDINMSVQRSYPAFCLFPALYAERAVFYTGERKLKDLLAFVHVEMEKAARDRIKEDDDRRKYVETMKAEKEKTERNITKDEL